MTVRTFKQTGQGYGAQPCSIVAKINAETVFSGEIPTLNQPFPILPQPDVQFGVDMFSWTVPDISFSGTQNLEIIVMGSPLLLTDTVANYVLLDNPDYPGPDPLNPVPALIPGGPDEFGSFYYFTQDGVIYGDPLSQEAIDGIEQSGPYSPSLPGQWYWTIPAGSVFTAVVHIQPGYPVSV